MFRIEDSEFVLEPEATDVSPEWLNAVQESFCEIIKMAKERVPTEKEYKSVPQYDLVAKSIVKIINGLIEQSKSKPIEQIEMIDAVTKKIHIVRVENGRVSSPPKAV